LPGAIVSVIGAAGTSMWGPRPVTKKMVEAGVVGPEIDRDQTGSKTRWGSAPAALKMGNVETRLFLPPVSGTKFLLECDVLHTGRLMARAC